MRTAESVVLTDWPPGPHGAEDVDLDVVLGDLDLVGLLDERDDLDGGEAGLAAALVVERADPHEPVGAGLDATACRRRRARRPRRSPTSGRPPRRRRCPSPRPGSLWRSAQRRYIRISISAKSAASTPPAPERIVTTASRSSYSPTAACAPRAADGLVQPASSGSASASVSASSSSAASSTSTSRSSMRSSSAVNRSSSAWRTESRPVTCCAFAWSSHRSGAATCSPRSAISARMLSRSRTDPMVFIVAWSCLISESKSVAATKMKATCPRVRSDAGACLPGTFLACALPTVTGKSPGSPTEGARSSVGPTEQPPPGDHHVSPHAHLRRIAQTRMDDLDRDLRHDGRRRRLGPAESLRPRPRPGSGPASASGSRGTPARRTRPSAA